VIVALAAWSGSGAGSGTASARTAQAITVTAGGTVSADLYPGGPAGTIAFTLSNPNPYAVTMTGVSYGTPTSNNTATCPSSDLSVSGTAPTSVSFALTPGASAVAKTITGVLVLALAAPDGCQGVSFTVPITLTGTQS
jgi:hypothetical protein